MAQFELRDGTGPDLPEVELDPYYNDVTNHVEIFLDEPHNTPDSEEDICSPRIVLTPAEAWTLFHALSKALGPEGRTKQ